MLNLSIIQGRITTEPVLEKSNSGIDFSKINIAVRRMNSEEVDFIDCVCFNKIAKNLCDYLHKGDKIIVLGTIQTQLYKDKNNISRKSTVLIMQQIYFPDRNNNVVENYDDIPPIEEGE